MDSRQSGVERIVLRLTSGPVLLGLLVGAALALAVALYWWFICSVSMPYTVQAIFTRLERMSSSIATFRAEQEEHFSAHNIYSADQDVVGAALEPGVSLEIHEATAAGYSASLRLPAAEFACDVKLESNADPPADLTISCRPCVLNRLVSLKVEPDSISLYAGETGRIGALAWGTGEGCAGALDTLYDWQQIPLPSFSSSDTAVVNVPSYRGSYAEIYARAPGQTQLTVSSGDLHAAAAITVLPLEPVEPLITISSGRPTCGLSGSGQLYCWGADEPRGVLGAITEGYCAGAGDVACSRVPRRVSSQLSWQAVATGGDFVCGIASDGFVRCWGRNDRGQLGDGSWTTRTTPAPIALDRRFTSITAGSRHVCAIATDYAVYCWGADDTGQLGDGGTWDREQPVGAVSDAEFVQISAGTRHTCGLTPDGTAYCWGSNQFLQLGVADVASCASEQSRETVNCSTRAQPVVTDLRFSSISSGARHTCALTDAGEAYCWGRNAAGEIGDSTRSPREAPTAVAGGLRFQTVSAGSEQTCGLTLRGETYCWGFVPWADPETLLPIGTGSAPVRVHTDLTFVSLDLGDNHVCALTDSGRGYCWGRNYSGQLGDGRPYESGVPTLIAGQAEVTPADR